MSAPKSSSCNTRATVAYFLRLVAPGALTSEAKLRKTNDNLGSYGAHDANLAFTGYGLLFVSEVLKRIAAVAAASESSGLGGASVLFGALSPALLQGTATRTRALSSLISDIRIFNRLWGLVPLAVWAADTARAPPTDAVLRAVAYTQVAANILYQPLENVAYLAMHGVLPGVSDRAQTLLWIYSCYLWAAHVVLDFVRVAREYQLAKREERKAKGGKPYKSKVSWKSWWQPLVINMSYLPLTVHWSLEAGCLPDIAVGFLGASAALASIYPRWTAIAATKDEPEKPKTE